MEVNKQKEIVCGIVKRAINITENTEHDICVNVSSVSHSIYVFCYEGGFTEDANEKDTMKVFCVYYSDKFSQKQFDELNEKLNEYEKEIVK